MNTKAFSLALLLSAPAMLRCDFWDELLAFFNAFNSSQQPSNLAPNATVDEFCAQLEHDLKVFEAHDRRQIIALTRQLIQQRYSLRPYESVSFDVARQCAKDAIIGYAETAVEAITNEKWLKESMQGNVLAILNKTDHIDGQKLSLYFGDSLKAKVNQAIAGQAYGHTPRPSTTQQPMYYPPVTQAPVVSQHVPAYQPISGNDLIKRIIAKYDAELSGIGMSLEERTTYKDGYNEKCAKTHYTEADLHRCMKKQLRDGLIASAHNEKQALAQKIKDKELLQKSVEDISVFIRSAIPDDTRVLDVREIRKYCKHNLAATIVKQMDIECFYCHDEYKDQIEGGEAGVRVVIPCQDPGQRHHVCSNCTGDINQCSCNGTFSRNDLNRNAQQAEQAHRAREQAERLR